MNVRKVIYTVLIMATCSAGSLPAIAQAKEEFDNLVWTIPAGLSVNKTAGNMILADAAGESYSITITRSTMSLKKIDKTFPLFWKEALVSDGFDNPEEGPQFIKFKNN